MVDKITKFAHAVRTHQLCQACRRASGERLWPPPCEPATFCGRSCVTRFAPPYTGATHPNPLLCIFICPLPGAGRLLSPCSRRVYVRGQPVPRVCVRVCFIFAALPLISRQQVNRHFSCRFKLIAARRLETPSPCPASVPSDPAALSDAGR